MVELKLIFMKAISAPPCEKGNKGDNKLSDRGMKKSRSFNVTMGFPRELKSYGSEKKTSRKKAVDINV